MVVFVKKSPANTEISIKLLNEKEALEGVLVFCVQTANIIMLGKQLIRFPKMSPPDLRHIHGGMIVLMWRTGEC